MIITIYREQIKNTRKATMDEQTVLGPIDVKFFKIMIDGNTVIQFRNG